MNAERRRRLADDHPDASPVLVALTQTATSLPVLLVGLPAGALADLVDRRRLLLVSQTWMLLAAGAAWLTIMSGFNVAAQTVAPTWVSRAT